MGKLPIWPGYNILTDVDNLPVPARAVNSRKGRRRATIASHFFVSGSLVGNIVENQLIVRIGISHCFATASHLLRTYFPLFRSKFF